MLPNVGTQERQRDSGQNCEFNIEVKDAEMNWNPWTSPTKPDYVACNKSYKVTLIVSGMPVGFGGGPCFTAAVLGTGVGLGAVGLDSASPVPTGTQRLKVGDCVTLNALSKSGFQKRKKLLGLQL